MGEGRKRKTIKERFLGWVFKAWGWKWVGLPPEGLKKYIVVVAPHTSNIDFFVGYTGKNLIGFHPNFLIKKELFKIPLVGWFLGSIGGQPVDRSKKTNMVYQIIKHFNKSDKFILTITPEGTRSYAPEWRTGFYRIAVKAGVPIVKIALDYPTKCVHVDKPFYPTGNLEKEMEEIKDYFRQFRGKHPELGVR